MSAHDNGSGPRSNRYSENRFTNWSEYEPWSLEVQAVFKRFDRKIAKRPAFPKIIELPRFSGFVRPCSVAEAEAQLLNTPPEFLRELRAVFILSGTKKQLRSWGQGATYYGHYWRRCVFLHPCPFGRFELVSMQRFYIRDVLMHEIGHHIDRWNVGYEARERFANEFARTYG